MAHIKKYWIGYGLLILGIIFVAMNWERWFPQTLGAATGTERRSFSVQREGNDVCYLVCSNGNKCKGKWVDNDCLISSRCVSAQCGVNL